jgi:hypothetical protein
MTIANFVPKNDIFLRGAAVGLASELGGQKRGTRAVADNGHFSYHLRDRVSCTVNDT